MPAIIIESDDNVKKYYAPVTTILIGKVDVVLDFKKKLCTRNPVLLDLQGLLVSHYYSIS